MHRLTVRVWAAAASFVLAAAGSLVASVPARADVTCQAPAQPDPSGTTCTVYVGVSGGGSTPPGGTGGGSGDGSAPVCTYALTTIDCYDKQLGWWEPVTGCYLKLADPQPPVGDQAWDQHRPPDGAVYDGWCLTLAGGTAGGYKQQFWYPSITTPPSVDTLRAEALAKLHMVPPSFTLAPAKNGSGLVGMPVWLSIQVSQDSWGQPPLTATASVPGLSLTAIATGQSITWDMGDGHTVSCSNPGTPYEPSDGLRPSPTCPYTYTQPSGGQPNGAYTITATITWQVAWKASTGQTGVITPAPTTTATTTVKVGELQAVNQ